MCVGVPAGRTRPALWLSTAQTGEPLHLILSQFHGETEAMVAVNFLDGLIDQIQHVIDHLAGDDSESGT